MNKRLKKKMDKKNSTEVKMGYGVIIDCPESGVIHNYKAGTEVKILGVSEYGDKYIECLDEETKLEQTVDRRQIVIY